MQACVHAGMCACRHPCDIPTGEHGAAVAGVAVQQQHLRRARAEAQGSRVFVGPRRRLVHTRRQRVAAPLLRRLFSRSAGSEHARGIAAPSVPTPTTNEASCTAAVPRVLRGLQVITDVLSL